MVATSGGGLSEVRVATLWYYGPMSLGRITDRAVWKSTFSQRKLTLQLASMQIDFMRGN